MDSRAKDGAEDTTSADSPGDSTSLMDGGTDSTPDAPSDVTTTADSETTDSAKMDAPADGGTVDVGTADAGPKESGVESGSETGSKDSATDTGADSPVESATTDAPAESGSDAGCATSAADSGLGGTLDWADNFGLTGETNLALEPSSGNIAMTGYFEGTADFGGGVVSSGDAGASASFLTLFDSSGSYKWGVAVTSAEGVGSGVDAYGAAMDTSGNVVMGGNFTGTADFGGGSVTATGPTDIFLAKYNSAGSYSWSKHFGYAGNSVDFRQATFDTSGNLYVVGEPQGSPIDLGCGALPTGMTMFVAEFDTTGTCVWSNAYAAYDAALQTDYTQNEVLAMDPTGHLLVAGGFYGTVNFGTGALTAPGIGMDVFVQKLSLTGTVVWAKSFGSGGSVAQTTGIAVDACGNILMDGTFSASIDFGTGTLAESGDTGNGDIFLAKLDPSGGGVWSASFGDPDTQLGGPLAVDDAGGPAITGSFSGTMNLGGGVLNGAAEGNSSMYIVKFNSAGGYEWAYAGGPPASNAVSSIGSGIAASGSAITSTGTFGGGTLSLAGDALTGGGNAYLARFSPE